MKSSLLAAIPTLFLAATLASGPSLAATTTAADQSNGNTAAATAHSADSGTTTPSSHGAATASSGDTNANGNQASDATANGGETMQQMAEQRIQDLHDQLHITSKQQSQWNRFANVMRANARDLDNAYSQRAQSFDSMNAVQNMQSYAKIERMRSEDVQKLVPAFQSLYASLSSEQKQTADTLFRERAQTAQQQHMNAQQNAQQTSH